MITGPFCPRVPEAFNVSVITQRLPETVPILHTLCNAGTTQNLCPLTQTEKEQKVPVHPSP